MSHALVYDGSFPGLLTCIFEVYERKLEDVSIYKTLQQQDAFSTVLYVETDKTRAGRVWKGLKGKLSREGLEQVYYCFLSEINGIERSLLDLARYSFASAQNIEADFGHPAVLTVAQTARKVWREKHRMEAFVRFQLTRDGIYYSGIEPDHNVLPLILPHFKSRYADQDWLIYDIKRRYGIYYDKNLSEVKEITLEWTESTGELAPESCIFEPEEAQYQQLWKDYFKHTGIPERRNMKLHIQHVPRRYWKYLTEKQ
jgi:probable DNA metabolism protein